MTKTTTKKVNKKEKKIVEPKSITPSKSFGLVGIGIDAIADVEFFFVVFVHCPLNVCSKRLIIHFSDFTQEERKASTNDRLTAKRNELTFSHIECRSQTLLLLLFFGHFLNPSMDFFLSTLQNHYTKFCTSRRYRDIIDSIVISIYTPLENSRRPGHLSNNSITSN